MANHSMLYLGNNSEFSRYEYFNNRGRATSIFPSRSSVMDGTSSLMFCTDSSMDSVKMASPPSQLAKFPLIKSGANIIPTGRQANNVAVVYSNEYTAKKSLDELFDLEKGKKERPMRARIFPETFFDQTSASSSASHSRDSLDSANYNSPKQTSMAHDGSSRDIAHLSLKRNQLKAKPMDQLASFDSKTRSLPCSFSPSKFDPNSLNTGVTFMPSSNLNGNLNSVQLESFSQLQRGLMNQNRLKSSDPNTGGKTLLAPATSVSTVTGQMAPNIIFNLNPGNPSQSQYFQQMHPSTINSQQLITAQASQPQQVQSNTLGQMATQIQQQYGQSQGMLMQDQSKDETLLHGLQQLENERAYMKKRQLELLQAKLIGPNTSNQRQVNSSQQRLQQANGFSNQMYETFNRGQQMLVGKPQSRQESIDSGLDLLCYSSSTESTNRVSPELFLTLSNGTMVATTASHLADNMQQYGNDQFGPALSQKLMTSQTATPATTSSGLFVGNADIVAQVTTCNFGRVKPVATVGAAGVSGLCTNEPSQLDGSNNLTSNNTHYLAFPTNNGSLIDDYIDSMSIASSPSTLDGNMNQESSGQSVVANRQLLMPASDTLAINQMHSGSLYDDSFLSTLLSGTEPVDFLDFNGNFNLSGHGVGTDGCDLQTGFTYNL